MRETLHTELVVSALEMAETRRRPSAGVLHHSDQGVQYASLEYRHGLERLEAALEQERQGSVLG